MSTLSALLVKLSALKDDLALKPQARGARKLLVTELFSSKENLAQEPIWQAPKNNEKCQVLLTKDFEMSVFNQDSTQDRHYHKFATEIYLVIEGTMLIEVENQDYSLSLGDSIIINPRTIHLVKSNQQDFLCYVFAFNCQGLTDKYIVNQ